MIAFDLYSILIYCFILRYVDMEEFKIKEEFLGFIELSSTTGSAIKDEILKQIENFGLDLSEFN